MHTSRRVGGVESTLAVIGTGGPVKQSAVRVSLIAAVLNGRVPILAASEPTTVAAYPGNFSAFISRCP
eukprot:9071425-Pyramimonas_sp.AAC.1